MIPQLIPQWTPKFDRSRHAAVMLSLALGLLCSGASQAQYRQARYGGFDQAGFIVRLESFVADPRNTDAVVAVVEDGLGTTTSVLPDWNDETTGRITFGYRWASSNKLTFSAWNFEADRQSTGGAPPGGTTHFTLGPPIPDGGGGYLGNLGVPGTYDIRTEIEARTWDLTWSRQFEAGDGFGLEWSLGVRAATFAETQDGNYGDAVGFDPGTGDLAVRKRNEADMVGLRGGLSATYFLSGRLSVRASFGVSMLGGEATGQATRTAGGTVGGSSVGPGTSRVDDDGRSGTIRELEAALAWTAPNDGFSIWLGWEQSEWEEIAADLMRNFPGSTAPLRERDSATFSGYKLGLSYNF